MNLKPEGKRKKQSRLLMYSG